MCNCMKEASSDLGDQHECAEVQYTSAGANDNEPAEADPECSGQEGYDIKRRDAEYSADEYQGHRFGRIPFKAPLPGMQHPGETSFFHRNGAASRPV